jgi:hypothetical protein
VSTLDFIVIGAPKSATTTLWQGLESHPELCLPGDKERGLFNSDDRYARGIERYVAEAFPHAQPGQRIGTVTPAYMMSDGLEVVVARMHATVPDVRLVAILRDPIERAISRFRQALRRGDARGGSFDEHVAGLRPGDEDLLADGEYGRILGRYLAAFEREQLLVLFTDDLVHWPAACYRRVFRHLGVGTAHVPPLALHLNRGGTRTRTSPDELEELIDGLRERVWAHIPDSREAQRAFEWWVRHLWNTEADGGGRDVSEDLRRRLQERYLADAAVLRGIVGTDPPWVAEYEHALGGARRSVTA